MRELNQYCEPSAGRKRRSLKSVISGVPDTPAEPITQADVDKLYHEIDIGEGPDIMTVEEYKKMYIVEANKKENILKKIESETVSHSEQLGADNAPEPTTKDTEVLAMNQPVDKAKLISKSLTIKHHHRHNRRNDKSKHHRQHTDKGIK